MAAWTLWIFLMCTALMEQGSKALDCGKAPLNTRKVGGENATAGSWPWQVSIHSSDTSHHICSGTLISDQWVLTGSGCIRQYSNGTWTLYLGRETQTGPNVNEVSRNVSKVIVHPDYNITGHHAIALMKLSSPVNFNDYISPICLASNSSQFHNSTLCWFTGWGSNYDSVPVFTPLQEVQARLVGKKQCTCIIQARNISDSFVCVREENKEACQDRGSYVDGFWDDFGGPLQCQQGSVWIQAAITTYRMPCVYLGYPEIYTKVSYFQNWILDQVAEANVSFVTFTSSGIDEDSSFVCRDPGNATTDAPASPASTIDGSTASTVNASTASTVNASTASTVNASTASTVNASTASTVNASTASTVNASTASTVNASTASTVNASTASTVNASTASTVNASTASTVNASTASTVNASTASTVNASTASTVNASTASTVNASTASTVNASTASTVNASTASTVGASTASTVNASTASTVGASTAPTINASTASTVGASKASTVSASTASTVGASTASTVVASTAPTVASAVATVMFCCVVCLLNHFT